MKSFDCPSNIGEGLFSNEAVKVQLNFPDGTSGIFDVHAMTQDMVVEFEKGGVKFQDYANQEEALENSAVIINRVVAGGEYKGVKIVDQLRRRILSNAGLTATLLNVSRKLAEETIEVEEKLRELIHWLLDPSGSAYWQTVALVARVHGVAKPKQQAPHPLPSNAVAWRAWCLCFPECRATTLNGGGFWQWSEVKTVLAAYGIQFTATIHRKLRVALSEAIRLERDKKSETEGKKNGQ